MKSGIDELQIKLTEAQSERCEIMIVEDTNIFKQPEEVQIKVKTPFCRIPSSHSFTSFEEKSSGKDISESLREELYMDTYQNGV